MISTDGLPRCVFVLGASFCGSTMLSRLMSRVPNVISPGELHWLLDDPEDKDSGHGCSVHGDTCPLVRDLPRTGLNDANLYARVLSCLDSAKAGKRLVTTDKWSGHAQRFLPAKQHDSVLLFKRPEAAVLSFMRHLRGMSVIGALELYSATYEHLMRFAYSGFFIHCLTISYDGLATDPHGVVSDVCRRYGLAPPNDAADMLPAESWHNIGGNPRLHLDASHARAAIQLDDRWLRELGPDRLAVVRADMRAQKTWNTLKGLAIA